MNDDLDLLRQYVVLRSEEAFAGLVERYLNLVYSAARRQVHSPELAEEIAQSVFADLARHANTLRPETVLPAWLYEVTRRTAVDVIRRETRRQNREQAVQEIHAMNAPDADADWTQIAPLLDEAMTALDAEDRSAVVLRYFENKSLREVGELLGTSADAAQKRVSRAVDRMRVFLHKRGVPAGPAGLAAVLSAHAVQAAPVGLSATIATAAVATALAAGTTTAAMSSTAATIAATTAITMTKKIIIAGVCAVGLGTILFQARQLAHTRDELAALQKMRAEETRQAEIEKVEAANRLAALQAENDRQRAASTAAPRLRPELTRNRPPTVSRPPGAAPAPNSSKTEPGVDLPKDSWVDAGFGTPQDTLRTRGWAIVNGNRDRFRESVFITDQARQQLEDMVVRMAEASKDPNKTKLLQEILDRKFGVEEGILLPMMAENQRQGYTGYRIVSQQPTSTEETMLELETRMASAPTRKEMVKFRRFGDAWKVVIDEDFIQGLH